MLQPVSPKGLHPDETTIAEVLKATGYLTDHLRDFVSKAVTPRDIEAAKQDNRHCLYFTGNGVPLAGDFHSIPEELRHIRLFAIGTDIASTYSNAASENRRIPKRAPQRTRYKALWPEGSRGGSCRGAASLAWTNWPLFTVGMVQRGYRDDDIQKILGLNLLRVARKARSD